MKSAAHSKIPARPLGCRPLGYNPQVKIADGIPRFVEWYRSQLLEKRGQVRPHCQHVPAELSE